MARPPRIEFPDALYHVTSRGNGRDVIFWSGARRDRRLAAAADVGAAEEGLNFFSYIAAVNAATASIGYSQVQSNGPIPSTFTCRREHALDKKPGPP